MSLAAKLPYDHPYAGGYPGIGSQPLPTDADALDYLARVKAADGAGVEVGVATAVSAFITDSKALGVWDSIRASCILAGARTLAGALVPLKNEGPELVDIDNLPTPSVNNFGGSCGTYVDGVMLNECVGTDAFQPRFSFNFGLVAGKQYAVEGRLAGDISEVSVRLGSTGTTLSYSTSTGIISGTSTTNTNSFVVVFNGTLAPTSVTIESLSIREVIASPTNVANGFVSGDYSRTAGLGDPGAASYLDTGRANNADPQNDNHLAVYETQPQSGVYTNRYLAGRQESSSPSFTLVGTGYLNKSASGALLGEPISIGLHAVSRSSSSEFQYVRASGAPQTVEVASSAVTSVNNMLVFTYTGTQFTDARIGFYSIGTSLSLADLDTAVTNLITRLKFALLVGENPSGLDPDTIDYIVRGYEAGGSLE